jgi:WhiB family redox-sensing transcriptional regulator
MNDTDWRGSAVCRQVDPELWFPEKGGDAGTVAKRICATCPVLDDCLEFAVLAGVRDGIWGGKAPDELRKIRKRRGLSQPAAPRVPVEQIRALSGRGWLAPGIAALVGCTERSVHRVLKAHREAGAA